MKDLQDKDVKNRLTQEKRTKIFGLMCTSPANF